MKILKNKGFSLLEIIFVVVILMILISVVIPNFAKFKNQQLISSMSNEIVSVLNQASSQSLNGLDSSSYGVYFASNQVVLFTGTTYDALSPSNKVFNLDSAVEIATINLTEEGVATSQLYFERLTNRPNASGNILLRVINTDVEKNISIDLSGRISVN